MGNNRKPNGASNRTAGGNLKYHQGFFKPKNPDKYMSDITKIIYRSRWELCFMNYCDMEPSIKRWSSEYNTIVYQDENNKHHRYYPDFYIEIIDPKDPMRCDKVVIEIKPFKEVKPDFVKLDGTIIPPELYLKKMTPKAYESYEYQLKTYMKNLQKWTKAKYWCEKNGMMFKIITENYLTEKKIM